MDLTWLTISGVLIGILVFSFKVSLGCGLASLSCREMLYIAAGYLVISLLMGMAIELLPENTLSFALNTGMAVHLLVALLLVALGIITAKSWNSHCHDISRKTFWALSLPCPACLAASFISCSFLAGLVEIDTWKIGLLVGFLFFFSIAAFSTALRRIKANPSSLGRSMIILGLFYILSILLIPAYINCQKISFLPPGSSAGEIIPSYLMILSFMALGFLGRRWGGMLLIFYETSVELLYIFSTAFLYPDIVALLLLFAWSLALLGSLINEYTSRHRAISELEEISLQAADLRRDGRAKEAAEALSSYRCPHQLSLALEQIGRSLETGLFDLKFEKILQDLELSMARALEPLRIGVKAGPILGLMGTLIPMGPALIGLSQGDIKSLADNLVIAFATTVIGLVVGGICYAVLVIRSRWCRQDLSDLEYVVELLRGRKDEAA